MANNVRFLDQVSVSSFGDGGGGSSISSSYAETASFAHFATSASYAVSASHEIIKEVSSSYADTASFAQSGNGIFSGSFSGSLQGNGSGLTNIPSSGIIGLPTVNGTANTIPIFTGTNAIGNSTITYDGGSFTANMPGGFFTFQQISGDYVRIFPSQNLISTDGNFLILEGSKGVTLTDGANTATYEGGGLTLLGGGFGAADQIVIRNTGDIEVTPDGGGLMKIQFPTNGLAYTYSLPTATGTIALLNNSGSGDFQATGSFTGSFIGDGSDLIGVVSSSYALTASYAVSASHEIIKEVSSSYADTASFAQSGNGIFSGSFSGSFEGNGSGLTSIPASGITGLPVVSGTTNTVPIFTSTNALGDSTITWDGESFDIGSTVTTFEAGSGYFKFVNATLSQIRIVQGNNANRGEITFGEQGLGGAGITANREWNLPDASGTIALLNNSGSGDFQATGSFTGSFIGNGSELIGVISSSYSTTASYVETAQTASYVLNAVSSSFASFAVSASYAVSSSHEIIKEVSSSYADTASFAQSGNGIFSGSFSGSYVGDGSGLTGVDPFPFSGSAVITGSLLVSGSSLPLEVIGSGSTIFSVQGSLGELFAIDDVLSGSLLTINDSGGDSQFEVFSDGRTLIGAEPRSLYTTAITTISLASISQSLYTLSTSSYDGVFFDYTVSSASNARAGNIMSIWNGGNLVYTENTTTDIGSTAGVTFNVEISQSQAQLISLTDTAGWKIKTTIRSI
jgi:hypothetical protein